MDIGARIAAQGPWEMTSQRLLSDMNLAVVSTDASIQVDLDKEMTITLICFV